MLLKYDEVKIYYFAKFLSNDIILPRLLTNNANLKNKSSRIRPSNRHFPNISKNKKKYFVPSKKESMAYSSAGCRHSSREAYIYIYIMPDFDFQHRNLSAL